MSGLKISIEFSYDMRRDQYVWTVNDDAGKQLSKVYLSIGQLDFSIGDKVVLNLTLGDGGTLLPLNLIKAMTEAYIASERKRDNLAIAQEEESG